MDPLHRAIELIKQGKRNEAQNLLKPLIAADHHNLPAWFWFVETCSTNKQRVDVLEICLKYNPDNEQIKEALGKLRNLPMQLSGQSSSIRETEVTPENSSWINRHITLFLMGLSILSGLLIASTSLIFGLAFPPVPVNSWIITLIVFLLLRLLAVEWILFVPQQILSWLSVISKLFSVLSGLSLAAIILIVYLVSYSSDWGPVGLIFIVFLIQLVSVVPWLLIIPATSAVCKIISLLSSKTAFDNIHPFFVGIPLIFNILGAAALIIVPSISDFYYHRGLTATTKSERFFLSNPNNPRTLTYEVILNVNNPSQKEISDVNFYLVTDKNKDSKKYSAFMHDTLGSNQLENVFPVGESEVVIDVLIYANENYSECTDGSLEKPLYLLYSVGHTYESIAVSNNINQKILETACTRR